MFVCMYAFLINFVSICVSANMYLYQWDDDCDDDISSDNDDKVINVWYCWIQ